MPPRRAQLRGTARKPTRLLRAEIRQSGPVLTVEQTTPHLAIDWSRFGINASESVVLNQPSAQSIALNRVVKDTTMTRLAG